MHLWEMKPVQDVFWLALAVILLWLGYVLSDVFVPMLIAFAAAYTVNPALEFVEDRWELSRTTLISGGLVVLCVSLVIVLWLVTPRLLNEVNSLALKAPEYAETIAARVGQELDPSVKDFLEKQKQSGIEQSSLDANDVASQLGRLIGYIGSFLGTTTYVLACLFLIPLYFTFFAWNYGPLLDRLRKWIPNAQRKRVLDLADRMDTAVGSFIRGRLLVSLCMMAMFSAAFCIAGVPYWFLIGCVTGLLSFVPYVAVVGCGIAILMTWVDASTGGGGRSTFTAVVLWPFGAYCIVQLIEGWLLTPWIQSNAMDMSPVTVLIVLMIGGSLAGIYGLLLAIPVAGCLKILAEEFLAPRLDRWAADAAGE